MSWRDIITDREHSPPMVYLRSESCPKLLEGHQFYACNASCAVPKLIGAKMMLMPPVSCRHASEWVARGDKVVKVFCTYGGEPAPSHREQFGLPTVAHANVQEDDGSHPD